MYWRGGKRNELSYNKDKKHIKRHISSSVFNTSNSNNAEINRANSTNLILDTCKDPKEAQQMSLHFQVEKDVFDLLKLQLPSESL